MAKYYTQEQKEAIRAEHRRYQKDKRDRNTSGHARTLLRYHLKRAVEGNHEIDDILKKYGYEKVG